MTRNPGKLGRKKSIMSIGLIGILLVVGVWGALSGTFRGANADNASQAPTSGIALTAPVSPLLFGANIDWQIAGNPSAVARLHVQTIRMGDGPNFASNLRAIKQMGLAPLVIIHGCGVADPSQRATVDTNMVQTVQQIFGGANARVYYELGNENDLQCGLSPSAYTNMWNTLIPSLKQLAPNSWFGGPVNFQQNPPYVAYFVHNATPKPDFVSWHEYTCGSGSPDSYCLQHIDNWTTHITDTNNAITANGDPVPPIMITEWNYAPDSGVMNDNKHNDPVFMSQWTTKALQTLAASHVFASYHFNVSSATPLIGSAQGQTFQTMYEQMMLGGQQPTPTPTVTPGQTPTQPAASPTKDPQPAASSIQDPQPTASSTQDPQPIIVPNTALAFSFEDGTTDGWRGHGAQITGVQNSSAVAFDGKQSLQVTLQSVGADDFPYVSVGRSGLTNYPQAGQTITAYVYLPANSGSLTAKLFIMDNQFHWLSGNMNRLSPGKWNRLTYAVPSNVSGQLLQLGIQFSTLGNTAISTDVYVDAVGWS